MIAQLLIFIRSLSVWLFISAQGAGGLCQKYHVNFWLFQRVLVGLHGEKAKAILGVMVGTFKLVVCYNSQAILFRL